MSAPDGPDDDVLVERDDEGNTWVIHLTSRVVMRKAAGPGRELEIVGRWDPEAGGIVLAQEEDVPARSEVQAAPSLDDARRADPVAFATAAEELAAARPPRPFQPPLAAPIDDEALRSLETRGYVVLDGVVDAAAAAAATDELSETLRGGGDARGDEGGAGASAMRDMSRAQADAGRSDLVTWLRWRGDGDGDAGTGTGTGTRLVAEALAAIVAETRRGLVVPPTAQLAAYARDGARYDAHLDNVRMPNGRWVNARAYTCIAYLTPGRGAEGGGALVLRGVGEDGDDVRVFPEAGRIVVFDSRAVRHEVTPIVGMKPGEARVALTLWALDPETPLGGGAP